MNQSLSHFAIQANWNFQCAFGILQSLFAERTLSIEEGPILSDAAMPFAIYLVPSRALAAEVESKLSRALKRLKAEIVVTSLYGGTDWGPTDAWLTEDTPTVLICTYEKAEALMRFLGPLFRSRISLVVIDEAHFVEFQEDQKGLRDLREAENRALRLEALGTRLFSYLDHQSNRAIALSAVAAKMETALASWVKGVPDTEAKKTLYRSTRQLIGRLECLPQNRYEIRYDLLDGVRLNYDGGGKDTPFIPNPVPPHPPLVNSKISGTRPYLFWAAMQLAKPDEQSQRHTVLISITQHISGYARDFLTVLAVWSEDIPDFFQPPIEGSDEWNLWNNSLKSCADYFTEQSREYRLLKRGIIVHHGKMPGLMARLFVELIQKQVIYVVLATSTLTDGVNLPFETILIPTLRRSGPFITAREFANLVGRAGRPGFGTEGQSLVLLDSASKERSHYQSLINTLEKQTVSINEDSANSPLAALLIHLEKQFQKIANTTDNDQFFSWLEKTAPIDFDDEHLEGIDLIKTLDSLDAILLSTIVELEQVNLDELSLDELEEKLTAIWERSFARYAYQEQARLAKLFVRRGVVLQTQIYPQSNFRRKLYRTSLPPRSGNQLLQIYPKVIDQLKTGFDYATWDEYRQIDYIKSVVGLVSTLPKFQIDKPQVEWENLLRWWFGVFLGTKHPKPDNISNWHDDVSRNFGYRFNWGLGSIISLAMEESFGDLLPSLEDWPQTGLPWVAFWLTLVSAKRLRI